MARAGLTVPDGYRITGDFEFNGGFEAMQKLLSQAQRPQAVFIGNDAMAFGAYQALYQAGLRVPHDMAVIGYDDIELARYMTPPLTRFISQKMNWASWPSMCLSTEWPSRPAAATSAAYSCSDGTGFGLAFALWRSLIRLRPSLGFNSIKTNADTTVSAPMVIKV